MMILGIDPGATGAAAVISTAGTFGEVVDLSADPAVICGRLDALFARCPTEVKAIVELAQSMPRQGVAGLARYMTGYGVILGWLATRAVPYELVRPGVWKKAMGLSRQTKDEPTKVTKERSRALAGRLFPLADLDCKKDHNRAEALLLAEWARRRRYLTPNA